MSRQMIFKPCDIQDPGYNTCRYVQLQCTYRGGCGSTLQSFAFECDDLINNRTQHCSNQCKNTLVGLMSTPEGQKLIKVSILYLRYRNGTEKRCDAAAMVNYKRRKGNTKNVTNY